MYKSALLLNEETQYKLLDYGIVVNEFKFQSNYYIHFKINPFGKGMNLLISPLMGKIVSLLFYSSDTVGIK